MRPHRSTTLPSSLLASELNPVICARPRALSKIKKASARFALVAGSIVKHNGLSVKINLVLDMVELVRKLLSEPESGSISPKTSPAVFFGSLSIVYLAV